MTTTVGATVKGRRLWVSRSIVAADAATTVRAWTIPVGTWIPAYGVSVIVKTLMAGGSPDYTVGDSANPATWLDTGDITEGTAGAYNATSTGASDTGKWYPSADYIDIVVTTGLTSGECFVLVEYYDMSDLLV